MAEKKRGRGRPRKDLDDETFKILINLIEIQCTRDEICGVIGIGRETLNKRLKERGEESFEALYAKHQEGGKASLRRAQWAAAMDGQPTMLVWLGKQVLGQRDTVHMGNDPDNPLTRPESDISDQELAAIAAGGGAVASAKAKGTGRLN